MKKTIFFFSLFLFIVGLQAKKVATFSNDFFKRPIVRLDEEKIYIIDQGLLKGFIYNRRNLEKIAEFGGRGEGPQEFTGITDVNIDKENIYISTIKKLCIFSKDGSFIKEIKSQLRITSILPLGNSFVGKIIHFSKPQNDYINLQFSLMDNCLHKKKNLLLTKIHKYRRLEKSKEIIRWIRDCVDAFVCDEKLFIGTTEKGFYFSVFDKNGQHLYDIKMADKKRKIDEREKEVYLRAMKFTMGKTKWNSYRKSHEIVFGDYYPEYQAFFVDVDKIYVFHFRNKKGNTEISILDLKGNFLKIKVITIDDFQDVDSRYHYVHKGKLYRMKENLFNWFLEEIDILN